MIISAVVVVDENEAIGYQNKLLCHLPNDLKRFKQVTMGHHILMGRKTFESIGRALPGRVSLVVSSNKDLKIEGCEVFTDLQEAISFAEKHNETELMLIGGGKVFEELKDQTGKIYYTRIHHAFELADAYFPKFDLSQWKLTEKVEHHKDEKNPFDHTFETWEKI